MEASLKRKINLTLFGLFYITAGINHFRDPEFYYPLIPDYLPYHYSINVLSGIVEIALGVAIFFVKTRRIASYCIILMLIAFIPSHIYFIQIGGCADYGLCVPAWIAWVRLIIIHPLLIWWALVIGRGERK